MQVAGIWHLVEVHTWRCHPGPGELLHQCPLHHVLEENEPCIQVATLPASVLRTRAPHTAGSEVKHGSKGYALDHMLRGHMLAAVTLRDRLAGYRSSLNAGTLSLHFFLPMGTTKSRSTICKRFSYADMSRRQGLGVSYM